MDEVHCGRMKRHGEITCALACDNAPRLASLLANGGEGHGDAINLSTVIATLTTSGDLAGTVSPAPTSSVVARDDLSRACRSAASARLPTGDVSLFCLVLFYGARRCVDRLIAGGARMDAAGAESVLVRFFETHAWREAAVCWGPCRLLQSRCHKRPVSPMIVAVAGDNRGSGSRVRFLDPLPVAQALAPFLDAATPAEEPAMRERLTAAVHASVAALGREGGAPPVAAVDRVLNLVGGGFAPESSLRDACVLSVEDGVVASAGDPPARAREAPDRERDT
ncbi:hypothetical protein pdul_cds_836 [Pandoravirus dulcis]|uniref:Uncharacterized protein n=1 Tax=Pandoravirus dulcis TaxID=1349409 RepID=S4VRY7_9VIRU|nr:hypothetical protein pdul_cds_836 [Pandoravirus dulcis]AGO83047.1 hypothetical protein pdul_cds_836 [Pandoravirus dulcis]